MTPAPSTRASMLTPAGRGGIAVICLRGADARKAVENIFTNAAGINPGELRFGKIISSGAVVDEAILACISSDEFEINIHGGSAVARLTLDALSAAGCDIVQKDSGTPEFSPKHPNYENPAIGAEMQQVLPQVVGEFTLGVVTSQWAGGLSKMLAGKCSAADLRAVAARFEAVRKLLDWPEVVIAGRPNAGKSTLANALVGRDVSIVHPTAGTTRDWVRERALVMGRPVWLTDTAGLWDAEGLHDVDVQSVERARKQIRHADLVVLACCGGDEIELPAEIPADRVLKICTKADEFPPAAKNTLAVSAVTGQGIDELKRQIVLKLGLDEITPGLPAAFTQRQQTLLISAADALERGDSAACEKCVREILISIQRTIKK